MINGAGGSIGRFAVRIAKSMDAEVTPVGSGIKEQILRAIGADYFVDYTVESAFDKGHCYDVSFDMVVNSFLFSMRQITELKWALLDR